MKTTIIYTVFIFLTQLSFGQNWVSVGGGADWPVRDIFSDSVNNRLYAVGEFHEIGGVAAYRTAYWDGVSWVSLCDPPYMLESNPIMWCTLFNNELFVSGTHSIMGDSITGKISHYVGNNDWESFGKPYGYCAIETIDDQLIAIGVYDSIGTKPIKNMATWDGISWEPMGDSSVSNNFNVSFIGDVEKYNSNYVFGGNIDSPSYKEVFQWNGANWFALGNGIPGDAWVNCLKSYQGILYIGGYFNTPGFPNYLVAWDGQNFFKPFPEVDFLGQVWDLEVINEELYIVGPVQLAVPNVTYGLTKFNGDSLCVFGGSGIWGSIQDTPGAMKIAELNGELYVTANKVMLNDTVNYIAKWNGTIMDECLYSPVHLGINESEEKNDSFTLFPNPITQNLTISSTKLINQIEIIDLFGRSILVLNDLNTLETTLDLSKYPNGNYIVKVSNDSNTEYKSLIKN